MNGLRDAKALGLKHMIGDYSVVVEVQTGWQPPRRLGYSGVSLDVALSYAVACRDYEFAKVKSITIKEVK